jgi:exosome complex component RRP42
MGRSDNRPSPKLKSQGGEDPLFDDDWESSVYLYRRAGKGMGKNTTPGLSRPPITLLVMVVGTNVIFDPSREELAVADGVFAVSVAESIDSTAEKTKSSEATLRICSVRTIDTPARDTMKGVPLSGKTGHEHPVPGVWQPRIGGIKRRVLTNIAKAVLGENGKRGVAADVLEGVEGFIRMEASSS